MSAVGKSSVRKSAVRMSTVRKSSVRKSSKRMSAMRKSGVRKSSMRKSGVRKSGVCSRASDRTMRPSLCATLLLLALCSCSPLPSAARPDRSAPPGGPEPQRRGTRAKAPEPSVPPELEFLAEFAGKHRLWVIAAPSHTDNYLRMMEKQIQDMEPEGLSCRLAERDTLIVTIVQNAMMEGKIRRPSFQGEPREDTIDSDMVTKLLHYLDLEEPVFSMLILKKNLLVGERFPYPVRVAAILEVIDQLPARKLEKLTRKGSTGRCKVVKKRVLPRKRGPAKRVAFGSQRRGNFTTVPKPRPTLDKKAVLRSQVQNILSGRSRFVIRKDSAGGRRTQTFAPEGTDSRRKQDAGEEVTGDGGSASQGGGPAKEDRPAEGEGGPDGVNSSGVKGDSGGEKGKSKSKKKGKGKKNGRKKGKGKKSQRDANDRDKKALKTFLEKLEGKRRLMVISAPGENSPAYLQQKAENQQNHCDLALRKVSMVTILGPENNSTLHLFHYLLDAEPPFDAGPDKQTDPGLIGQIRKEYGIIPKDFSLVLTDYDLRSKKLFQSPVSTPLLMDNLDSFPSREPEMKREKSKPAACPTPGAPGEPENSLLRFMSKRRLLIISTPSEDDYSFQQQLQALNGQSCHLGIRHFALLKLVGAGSMASGSVELLPLNGKSQSELEPLTGDMVNGLRGHLKITREYFSMLVVGKDGEVKAWFPSPMWSLVNVYDLVDSMEQRQQEQRLQGTLGIQCPEDSNRNVHGYEDEGEESYLYRRPED
ncbi:coiled-coil domain-containing protein 80 [Anguilla anguilla]|uniref:coiled-coil domain-containing protein 80 n=1 Tax=Anguilla anguilla TaxID=7936 RepID=UPI0015B0F697|nr:coiled-coil domain-containing protein 80 [Anguilla anguilla]